MSKDYFNLQLETAVRKRDKSKIVEDLLIAGADPNLKTSHLFIKYGSNLLHDCWDVKIIEILLKYGARVDSCNDYRETPLHSAITLGKSHEIVGKLLEYGAYVDRTNRHGQTPLYQAIRKVHDDWNTVVEILWHKPDLNHSGCLNHAIRYRQKYAFLMIKMSILTHHDGDFEKKIDLLPFRNSESYRDLSDYLNKCIEEIKRMNNTKIDGMNLCELLTFKKATNKITRFISLDRIKSDYTVYQEMLISLRDIFLKDKLLVIKMLEESIIHTTPGTSLVIHLITEYLSTNDLMNIVMAFKNEEDTETTSCTDEILEISDSPKKIKLQ